MLRCPIGGPRPGAALEVGAGVDRLENSVSGGSRTDARAFLRWQRDY